MDYQRKHRRYAIDTPASVSVLGLEEYAVPARVADISAGGLKLLTDEDLVIGETLRVEIETEVLVGVVRNCERSGAEYICGLELINCIERDTLQSLLDEWAVEVF